MKLLLLVLTTLFLSHGAFAQMPALEVQDPKVKEQSKFIERSELGTFYGNDSRVWNLPKGTVFKVDEKSKILILADREISEKKCDAKGICCYFQIRGLKSETEDMRQIVGAKTLNKVYGNLNILTLSFRNPDTLSLNCTGQIEENKRRPNDIKITVPEFANYLKKEWGIELQAPLPKEVKRKVPADAPGAAPEVAI